MTSSWVASGRHRSVTLQLLGRAGAQARLRMSPPALGLSHNLGGMPNQKVAAVAIIGMLGASRPA